MSMGPLLKYRLSMTIIYLAFFARQQDATSTCGVCLGGRQFATPGDRIAMLFAAVHESGCGTFETCRRSLAMSVYWDRPEMLGAGSK